jgi:hypothetical protein
MLNVIKNFSQVNENLMVSIEKGGVCLFDENLRNVNVSFQIRGGVSVVLIDIRGGDCNFSNNLEMHLHIV